MNNIPDAKDPLLVASVPIDSMLYLGEVLLTVACRLGVIGAGGTDDQIRNRIQQVKPEAIPLIDQVETVYYEWEEAKDHGADERVMNVLRQRLERACHDLDVILS